ncbi:MAG: hypothetical protein IJZ56_03480, partial [Oscillospiraceae bacterium]|nr:hypothetical protein [Oscillospiraceae bacterium]
MKTLTIGGITFKIVDDEAVRYTEQTPTEEQQEQARENINAENVVVSVSDIEGGHRVTFKDSTGENSIDVMDGEPGVYTLGEGETLEDVPEWAEVVVDPNG